MRRLASVDRAATAGVAVGYRRQDLPRDPPAKPLILTEVPGRDTAPRPRKIHLGIIDNLPGHIATVTPRSSRPAKTDRHITTPMKNPAGAGLSAGPSGASRTFGPRFKQDRSFQNPAKAPLSRAFTAPLCSAQSLNHCRNVACSDHLRRAPSPPNAILVGAAEHWPGFHGAAPATREVSSASSPPPGRSQTCGNVRQHRALADRECELDDCSWSSCLFPPERKTSRPPICSLVNSKFNLLRVHFRSEQ